MIARDQYHHFIPRFILRRFQVEPVKSKAERRKVFRLTGVDPEYVHYYDIATSSLDTRPIGQVYGVQNFYQDVRNTENINELEEKLADLELKAASIIEDMHKALPRGTFTLKRRDLELLRKFLFVMHYRRESCSSQYFQADHPGNAPARQWIECFMKAKGIQSAVEAWLHVLRYYLDTSHSDIMRHAAELVDKYGEAGLQKMFTETHVPPDLEHYPALAYRLQADHHFLSIWEAAEGQEFVLTHNGFGLWEGLLHGEPHLHRIFVVSPRITIILRHAVLRPEFRSCIESGFRSTLLNVNAAPATPIYGDRAGSLRANSKSARSLVHYRSSQEAASDSFVFEITKLSRAQTLNLNSVVLLNVEDTGSLTFLSKEHILHTVHAFRSSPSNFPQSNLVAPLIERLTASMETELSALRSPSQSSAAFSDEDIGALSLVDVVLYVLLMQICTGRRRFPSAYDRAHLVLKIMEKAKPTLFAHEISQEVEKAFQACEVDLEDVGPFPESMRFAPLLPSIPNELSSQLFHLMIPYMSKRGAGMSRGKEVLEELQDEVAVVSFLTRASCSPGVWHALSCSSTEAPKILSGLLKEDTPADELVINFGRFLINDDSPSALPSCYTRAYGLRTICGMGGPTTNHISQTYYWLSAVMIKGFGSTMVDSLPAPYSSRPCKRPKARLVRNMSKTHSDLLLLSMKIFLQKTGFRPSLDTITKCVEEAAIVNALAWLGMHRRNFLDFLLDSIPEMPVGFKLFEDEEAIGST
ncbi:hypothetical protein K503DRAFT_721474 [Rhizopogon vinicolor AM-OR11-026]|uniref:DUF4238 domain-containing protein n=1 Tax=Rhizopogon vinicolor AM-OR11-026 TaxID=1314800 RepID=A0A1B7MUX3_9AGAM|nr:hypothetical protein K503DRAFT_721474 [Rhizopogon vinicolor AM-OR11-026]